MANHLLNVDDIGKVLLERKILASAIIYVKPQIK